MLEIEAAEAAEIVWHRIRDVYDSVVPVVDESHRHELKTLFDASYRRIETTLGPKLEREARSGLLPAPALARYVSDALRPSFTHARNKQHLAIDMHIDRRLNASTAATPTSITHNVQINAPVGIVQTGAGANANMSHGFTSAEQAAMLDAIAQAFAAIIKAPVGTVDATNLLGIASMASEVVKSPSPDRSKLRQAFDVLSSAIQSIGSAPQAYAALQTALSIFG